MQKFVSYIQMLEIEILKKKNIQTLSTDDYNVKRFELDQTTCPIGFNGFVSLVGPCCYQNHDIKLINAK